MRDRVRIVPTGKAPSTRAEVEVIAGANRYRAEADSGVPSDNLVAQREALTKKFLGLVTPIAGIKAAPGIADAALGIDGLERAVDLVEIVNRAVVGK
jgi:hypothetical protein